jgi:hypothetical protein
MMGYSKDLKSYQLFDPIQRQVIVLHNFCFDEKSSRVKLLNYSSVLLQDDPFDIVLDTSSPAPPFSPSTSPLNLMHVSTRSLISEWTIPTYYILTHPLIEELVTFDQPDEVNHSSYVSFLPQWVVKIIEATGDSSYR